VTARTVRVTAPAAEAELAADALWQAGAVAIEERAAAGSVVLVAAGPGGAGADPGPLLAAVAGRWPAEVAQVDLDAVLDAWRRHARPVVVGGGRLTVRLDGTPDPRSGEIVVDPGRAFGSGAHPSTRLVLEALVGDVRGGERVLDAGSGSGILAVAALALGAAAALAVDIDPSAREATAANAARNGLADRLTVSDTIAGLHDLVVANVLLADHRALAPAVAAAVADGGTLIASGVLAPQRDALRAAYPGLTPAAERQEDGWLALSLRAP
jgi:ribosomal protein L11 methyltransferase